MHLNSSLALADSCRAINLASFTTFKRVVRSCSLCSASSARCFWIEAVRWHYTAFPLLLVLHIRADVLGPDSSLGRVPQRWFGDLKMIGRFYEICRSMTFPVVLGVGTIRLCMRWPGGCLSLNCWFRSRVSYLWTNTIQLKRNLTNTARQIGEYRLWAVSAANSTTEIVARPRQYVCAFERKVKRN